MKTGDILLLDCSKKENIEILNKVLHKIKPIKKMCGDNKPTIEQLEKAIHMIANRYGYRTQQIWFFDKEEVGKNAEFQLYSMGIVDKNNGYKWIGNVTGITLWELIAKGIIKIYGDIKRKEREQ